MKKTNLLLAGCLLNFCLWSSHGYSGERNLMKWPASGGSPAEVVYLCGKNMSLEELGDCGGTLYTHFPCSLDQEATKKFIERAHRMGIKVLPYVSAEKAWDDFNLVQSRNSSGSVPYYQAVSPKEHRDWVFVRSDGVEQARYARYKDGKWIWDAPGPGSWYMCPNSPGYVEAVIKGCRDTMEMGFDGLFIDNAGVARFDRVGTCYGPKYGKHQHLYPDKDERYAYTELIKKMAEAIKSCGKDRIVFLNDGLDIPFDDYRDAGMLESYCVSSFLGPEYQKDWTREFNSAKRFRDETKSGRIITCLPYIDGKDRPAKDDAFYCYGCCQFSGFTWASTNGAACNTLFLRTSSRLGRTVSDFGEKDGVHYRIYEKGLVVVNPSKKSKEITLPSAGIVADPVSLYDGACVEKTAGAVKLTVPASSGRVYMDRKETMRIFLEEMRLGLRRAILGKSWEGQDLLEDKDLDKKSPELTEALRKTEALLAKISDTTTKNEEIFDRLIGIKASGRVSEFLNQAVSAASGVSAEFEIEPKLLMPGESISAVLRIRNASSLPVRVSAVVPRADPAMTISDSSPASAEIGPGKTGQLAFTISRGSKESSNSYKPYYKMCRLEVACSLNNREFQLSCASAAWLLDGVVSVGLADPGISPPYVSDIGLQLENLLKKNVSYDVVAESPAVKLSPARRTVSLPAGGKTESRFTVTDTSLPPGKKTLNVKIFPVTQLEEGDVSLPYIPGSSADPAAGRATPIFSVEIPVYVVPTVSVPAAAAGPVIDGKLDDACWKTAAVLDEFRIIGSQEKARGQTTAWLCHDDRRLYLGIKCVGGRVDPQKKDDNIFANRNRVEVFIDVNKDGKGFVRGTATSTGRFQLDRKISGGPVAAQVSPQYKILAAKGAWTMEIALEFENPSERPAKGALWKLNICRDNFGESSQWSVGKGFHDYSVFGYLQFN